MLRPDDPWLLDDPVEGAGDLFRVLPEMRPYLAQSPQDDDLGLRSLLEQPEALAHSWWRNQASKSARTSAGSLRPRAA
ncbi:MAG TPA: hypothetical protein VHB79_06520 [Polyangiaceae bacterium]|nr:hypothetical protein [Polyangiaceae bacterium]